VKSIRSSLHSLDELHPLLVGVGMGLSVLAGHVLVVPDLLDRPQAWALFFASSAGGTLGRWLQVRRRDSHKVS
jgi:hypothetical protein